MSIKDVGKGFDHSEIMRGNGLDNMKNRANELRGELEIVSKKAKGTTICLKMPM